MEKILLFLMPPAVAATAIYSSLVWGWYRWPQLIERLDYMLNEWFAMTFGWVVLAVVGIDYALVSLRDFAGFRNVGQKSAAHDQLSRRGH